MPDSRAELKARLQAEAEAAIEQLLAERKPPAEASLADNERVVRNASLKLEQALMAQLLAESAAALPAWPACPQCGQKPKNKGKRRRRVVTEAGKCGLERHYYHCGACGQGVFPWMNAGGGRQRLSPQARQADGLAGGAHGLRLSGRSV